MTEMESVERTDASDGPLPLGCATLESEVQLHAPRFYRSMRRRKRTAIESTTIWVATAANQSVGSVQAPKVDMRAGTAMTPTFVVSINRDTVTINAP